MLDAILHAPWTAGKDGIILGVRPEDQSNYEIICPIQLRDEIIKMQNALFNKQEQVTSLQEQLIKAKNHFEGIFK